MKITIYGTSCCSKCSKVEEIVKEVVEENKIDVEIEKINNPIKAAEDGIMSLPCIAVNGEIKVKGKACTKEKIEKILNA